ncbi:MAG TPA: helix-turn-helix domain-containing protein [Flavisolibacter sp.]|jgi:DNA-binding HxlR family transcriptional regulator|nr:helix-turn-helix domain-containing protein [Flavisolibacter sp.]
MTQTLSPSRPACQEYMLPIRDALELLSGKWKVLILVSLSFGSKRFKEIQKDLKGITAKTLSKELKELEVNGLVCRCVHDEIALKVEYGLTPYSYTLEKLIGELHQWGSTHRQHIFHSEANPLNP